MTEKKAYIIVGAGVFGASTALHLRQGQPEASVIVVDALPPNNAATASSDLNKIMRADYADVVYMHIALEAKQAWRNDPRWKPYYHEPGMLFADDASIARNQYETIRRSGIPSEAELMSREEAGTRFKKWFRNAKWEDVPEAFYNPRSGWCDADGAMLALRQACEAVGVQFVRAQVAKLWLDHQNVCKGVILEDESILKADVVVACTGAWTAKLLADTGPDNSMLQVDGRLTAAGAASCIVRCTPEHLHRYQDAPIHILAMPHTFGECIPPNNPEERLMKFNFEVSVTNIQTHSKSGQRLSIPPAENLRTWGQDIPSELKSKLQIVIDHIWGKDAPGLEIQSYRTCWDAVTPNEDFIISPHPHCSQLYIATGGSFHAWKFMPVIGRYVVQMLNGTLDQTLRQKWAWDRDNQNSNPSMYVPRRDWSEITENRVST